MSHSVTCPACHTEFEVTAALRGQLEAQVRGEYAEQLREQRTAHERALREVASEKERLAAAEQSLNERVQRELETQRSSLVVTLRTQLADEMQVQLADKDSQLQELKGQLGQARQQELELLKRKRELEAKAEELELHVQRQLQAERAKIRNEAVQQIQEQHALKEAEKDKTIQDLSVKLKEVQRKLEQGSQRLQGEVLELALEDLLRSSFVHDSLSPVAKGVAGGDCLQQVQTPAGHQCGTILWETKRTKSWSNAWLAKARDDQRAAGANVVVLVTEALPDGVRSFDLIGGVWVCSWAHAKSLAMVLRHSLLELAKSTAAKEGQNEKMELIYGYLSRHEFRQRIEGIVEACISMQRDIESEKRSFNRIWKKREQEITRTLMNTACFYGDLQGIVGGGMLPNVSGLALHGEIDDADVRQEPRAIAAIPA